MLLYNLPSLWVVCWRVQGKLFLHNLIKIVLIGTTEPNLMNLNFVDKILTTFNLNHWIKVKEGFKFLIQIWTGRHGVKWKFVKFGHSFLHIFENVDWKFFNFNFAFLIDITDNIITYSPYYGTRTSANDSAVHWSHNFRLYHVTRILHNHLLKFWWCNMNYTDYM